MGAQKTGVSSSIKYSSILLRLLSKFAAKMKAKYPDNQELADSIDLMLEQLQTFITILETIRELGD